MSGRIRLSLRAASTTPVLSLFLVIVIAALTLVGVAAPALLTEGRTATIRQAVTAVPELGSWPFATTTGLPALGSGADSPAGALAPALAVLEHKREQQPQPLKGMLGEPRLAVTVAPAPTTAVDATGAIPLNKLGLVSDPGFIGRSVLVDGRLPEPTDPNDGIEIALTSTVAEELAWEVGAERLWNGLTLILTGTVEPARDGDRDWTFVSGSRRPTIENDRGGNRILVGAGFMHVDEIRAFARHGEGVAIISWIPFDGDAVQAGTARKTAAQLRRLTADPVQVPLQDDAFFMRTLQFRSGVPQALDAGLARADAMTPVVTVAAVGPAVVALVVLVLVSRLIAIRRVAAIGVLRARGASVRRLALSLGAEGAALGVIGAAVGAAVAAAWAGWSGGAVLFMPAVLAAVPAVTLPWSALTDAERRGRRDLGDGGGDRTRVGTLTAELLIAVVTVLLVALVLLRGAGGGADPLLLALLVLLGFTGTLLSLRLLPPLLGLAEHRARRRSSLEALLGPARARRDSVMRAAPVLAMVMGLGVVVFSVAFASTVSSGIVRAAAVSVGADLRIDAPYITDDGAERVADIDGVDVSAGLGGGATTKVSADARSAQSRVYIVDRDDFVAAQRDAVTPLPLPEELSEPPGDAVPVVMSEALLSELGGDDIAESEIKVGARAARIVATAPSEAPFGTAERWVIVDRANVEALRAQDTGLTQLYIALSPGADAEAVGRQALAQLGSGATFTTPAQVAAAHEQDPGYAFVLRALLAASAIVAVLLMLGVVATLMLSAASRARMLAILSTLGHRRRAAGRLVLWEVGPALLTALPLGAGVGIAMVWLVIPQLDLHGFVGGSAQPPVVLGGIWPVIAVVAFTVVSAAAVAAAAALASRLAAADVIRTDGERE
ncbi:ABC transporter permease [Microbacterium sp. ARD32]|uniref:ABC transporter permease n=1 Tax=Microbacterium sp. ARD32 TaxID=2962577 RepID=UPI00288150DC|nr:ABC transporter permease [Microbacterium sp. ARD32]MDT0157427.1 ABC transporter permease [Microbacterium sp. ARD32]